MHIQLGGVEHLEEAKNYENHDLYNQDIYERALEFWLSVFPEGSFM